MDVDKVVDSIVDDLLPAEETVEVVEDENETPPPIEGEVINKEEEKVPVTEGEEPKPKLELKPGDEGYVAPEVVEAPKSWSKEIAPEFTKLAKPVQEYIRKREEDFTNGITQYKQAADYARAVHSVVQPYMAHLQSRGVDVPTAMRALLNADYTLSTADPDKKAALFTKLMQDYGVDPAKLGKLPAEPDPNTKALTDRLAKTEGVLNEFQTAQIEERRKEVVKAVDKFAADPKNLYFAELSDDIVKLINAGYTLEEAYDKAVWANPVTRAKEQVRTSKSAEEARKKAASEAALAAKKAAKANVKETPSNRSAPTSLLGSMDDTLRSTMRKINERTN